MEMNPRNVVIAIAMAVIAVASAATRAQALPAPTQPDPGFEPFSFVNFETPHVHPLDLTPDGQTLLAVNTADNALMVFDVSSGVPQQTDSIAVGLDPVSVRARTDREAWVVNQVSDSISIVDLQESLVTRTLTTADEPADVVFAGTAGRAFVSASQVNRVQVFNADDPGVALREIVIHGEDPRMLAVSPDGRKVYAGIFESGNATTLVAGGMVSGGKIQNAVDNPAGPWGGVAIPPNDGNEFSPALNPENPDPVEVAMIVRKSDDSRWLDDNGGDWTRLVSGDMSESTNRVAGWDLVDHDVAVIDAENFSVSYIDRMMNMIMALDVNPASGRLMVVGTEATNEIRWEPNLQSSFVRSHVAVAGAGSSTQVRDLNRHLDYSVKRVPQERRNRSIGDPRGLAWANDGSVAYVTGMGSNNVVFLRADGVRTGNTKVGEGPTGIVVDATRPLAYILNKFAGSISVLDLSTRRETRQIPFHDPTPIAIKQGRPHLYNTQMTSGLGQASCASCHVDLRTDRLVWDLGNPAGEMKSRITTTGEEFTFHPIKGPLKTQSLQDIIGVPAMHHIGDKDDIFGFADAFRTLQGDDAAANMLVMSQIENMLDTVHYPPNPNRNIDNSLSRSVNIQGPFSGLYATGDAVAGRASYMTGEDTSSHCFECHGNSRTRGDVNKDVNNAFVRAQPLIAENLRGFYDRMGMFRTSATGSTSGFGFLPNGAQSSELINTNRNFPLQSQSGLHVHAFLLSLEGPVDGLEGLARDAHAGTGQQVTLGDSASNSERQRLTRLVAIADSGNIGLTVDGRYESERRSFYYLGQNVFQSDRLDERVTLANLRNAVLNGSDTLTFTLVPVGSQYRIGVDRDTDGVLDGDEQRQGGNAADPSDGQWNRCAAEGSRCNFTGALPVRFGSGGQYFHAVFENGMQCRRESFGILDAAGLPPTMNCETGAPLVTDPEGPDPVCSDPSLNPRADNALIAWVDCAGELHIVGSAGLSYARISGRIHASTRFDGSATRSFESSDTLTRVSDSDYFFEMGMGGGFADEIVLTPANGAEMCVVVNAQTAGTVLLAGAERTPVTSPFNPVTFDSCAPPDGGSECGNPQVDPRSDSAFFIWKNCDGRWSVVLTGVRADGGGVNVTGNITSSTSATNVARVGIERSDTLTTSPATRLAFDMRTINPWSDGFDFEAPGDANLCVTLTSVSPGLDVLAGYERTPVGISFDPRTFGTCR